MRIDRSAGELGVHRDEEVAVPGERGGRLEQRAGDRVDNPADAPPRSRSALSRRLSPKEWPITAGVEATGAVEEHDRITSPF
ncbi:MAG: hypothetical protein QOD72_1490 [Acidimicrobiaceae bacterium]|nr:hypothetical protein [Acidimicrobiaceae bacterium]